MTSEVQNTNEERPGLTLLGVILIATVIAVIGAVAIFAMKPNRASDSRNAERANDIAIILDSMYEYAANNNDSLPPAGQGVAIGSTPVEICQTNTTCPELIDLSALTNGGKYLVKMPVDPQCPAGCGSEGRGTGYMIAKGSDNRLTVTAKNAENDKTIAITR